MAIREFFVTNFWWVKPLSELVGFWRGIASVALGVGFFVWSVLSDMPTPFAVAAAFAAFAGAILLLFLPALIRKLNDAPPKEAEAAPNFAIWAMRDNYQLYEAACLIGGVTPRFPIRGDDARAWYGVLTDAIRKGELEFTPTKDDEILRRLTSGLVVHHNVRIQKTALKKYCQAHEIKQQFLD